ncbi:MAG: right-handed parallel beta-helix repeat-containing protein [Deltaproteobacteria bacterium]|nr:right-handed parallel beta-helix repeat-containing protein [Deltaproteobacteria bacterium]
MRKVIYSLILILGLVVSAECLAADLLVPEGFKTIRQAVDSAMPGDTIIINEGVYSENLIIRKPVTIKSVKGDSFTIIRAANPDQPVIKIVETDNVTITGVAAKGSRSSGITLVKASRSNITDNTTSDNVYGISLYDSNENVISGNTAASNEYYGIYLERSSGNTLLKNTANHNLDKGFFISYSNRNTIKENSANLNTWNGITLWSSHDNIINGNMTLRNTYGIVVSDSNNNELTDNTTLPNVFIILPIVLIYLGIITYMIQKNILRLVYRS